MKSVKAWFDDDSNDLFICPRLPGKLRLSQSACARRFKIAQGRKPGFFGRKLGPSLEACRDCPIGRVNLVDEASQNVETGIM